MSTPTTPITPEEPVTPPVTTTTAPVMTATKKSHDWVERDDDFVFRNKDGRSGWDRGRGSLTDYLLEKHDIPKGKEFEIKKAYQLCQDRAAILTDKPARIIFSDKEETGKTDGKRVFVSTKVMDERKDFVEKADILLGITTHEMAHVMHTDFGPLKKMDQFTHTVWNVIEDERIERLIGEEFPGYSGNIAKTKEYIFDEKYKLDKAREEELMKEMEEKAIAAATAAGVPYTPPPPLSPEDQEKLELWDLFFKLVRYPKNVDSDMYGKHEVVIEELKKIVTPYPTTSNQVLKAADQVTKLLRKSFDDMDPMGAGGGGGGAGTPKAGGAPGAKSRVEGIISEAMTFATSENEEGGGKEKETMEDIEEYDYEESVIDDTLNKAIFRNSVPKESRYKDLLKEVKGDAQLLARSLYVRTFNETKHIRGMRSGTLDDNRIVEAVHGVKTVYNHKIDKVDKKMNMCLLIDESGSMGGSKCRDAAKVAILLEECYRILPMGQLFIYGFTSDMSEDEPYFNRIIRYKEPGYTAKYGLGDVDGRCNNRDGMCIRAVVNRVRTFTQEPMLFFVISDGQPAASGSYGGMGGIEDTRKAVLESAQRKFFPIQIGIGVNPSVQKLMFDDYVTYSDSRQMVEDLRKLLLRKAHKFTGI
jgi:hypothetical protein